MSELKRPLTQAEKMILRESSSAQMKRSSYLASTFGALMLFGVMFATFGLFWDYLASIFEWPTFETSKQRLAITSAILSLGYTVKVTLKEYRSITSKESICQQVDEDLRNGIAVVERLVITEVVEVEEFDDEGAGFLLQVKDGRVLFLVGQHLYPFSLFATHEERSLVEGDIFPSDQIDFIYAPKSRVGLGATGTGELLKPRGLVKWRGNGPRTNPYNGPQPDHFTDGPLKDVIRRAGLLEEAV